MPHSVLIRVPLPRSSWSLGLAVPPSLLALADEVIELPLLLRLLRAGYGTCVWTGRALQVGYDGLEIVGLAHLYSAL